MMLRRVERYRKERNENTGSKRKETSQGRIFWGLCGWSCVLAGETDTGHMCGQKKHSQKCQVVKRGMWEGWLQVEHTLYRNFLGNPQISPSPKTCYDLLSCPTEFYRAQYEFASYSRLFSQDSNLCRNSQTASSILITLLLPFSFTLRSGQKWTIWGNLINYKK